MRQLAVRLVGATRSRNLLMEIDDRGGQRPRLLIHDRDSKFSRAFDGVFRSDGIRVIRTPARAPNANAHIERWAGSVRRECLDRLVVSDRDSPTRPARRTDPRIAQSF